MSPDVDEYAEDPGSLSEEITSLRAEVARLRNQEALKNIAEGEIQRLKHELAEAYLLIAGLRDQRDEMITDMALMEDQIAELSGRKGITPDYE